ncbi:MAG: nicotinate phosphoribosyltransferase [bacterium]
MFHIATEDEIKAGAVTDVYFQRTEQILRQKGIDQQVVAEVTMKDAPSGWNWGVLAGIEEAARLLEGLPIDVCAMAEGTLFGVEQPVLTIEGKYLDFLKYETSLLGLLCQASGIATKASRCRKAAGERILASFGARRMHPAIAPMIERSAFIGGCNGVAVTKSAELIHEEPVGTMPHSLILLIGDTVAASSAFHEIIDPKVNRVALIDTFCDEKEEAIRVARQLGQNLFAVRLDTPSSRRGNMRHILEEVRWELNLRGFQQVKLFVSGGIDEYKILELNPVADAYGVGTYISNAPVSDFALDIVEVAGQPLAKRGKKSGRKTLLRCPQCFQTYIRAASSSAQVTATAQATATTQTTATAQTTATKKEAETTQATAQATTTKKATATKKTAEANTAAEAANTPHAAPASSSRNGNCSSCGTPLEPLLTPLIQQGKVVRSLPSPQEIRAVVLQQLWRVSLS